MVLYFPMYSRNLPHISSSPPKPLSHYSQINDYRLRLSPSSLFRRMSILFLANLRYIRSIVRLFYCIWINIKYSLVAWNLYDGVVSFLCFLQVFNRLLVHNWPFSTSCYFSNVLFHSCHHYSTHIIFEHYLGPFWGSIQHRWMYYGYDIFSSNHWNSKIWQAADKANLLTMSIA